MMLREIQEYIVPDLLGLLLQISQDYNPFQTSFVTTRKF